MKKQSVFILSFIVLVTLGITAQEQDTSLVRENAAEDGCIKGTVFDLRTKEPLPGVKIIILNSNDTNQTDIDGKFIINEVPTGDTINIQVTMGCYELKRVTAKIDKKKHSKNLSIFMKPSNKAAHYGRSMIYLEQTGSVRIWTKEEINKLPGN